MNAIKITVFGILLSQLLIPAYVSAETPQLPEISISGVKYQYYEIKKGDSPYGIAKKFGWDYNTLLSLNSDALTNMKKGAKLFYPLTENKASDLGVGKDDYSFAPIMHVVKKGETVYGISRQYGVSEEDIYKMNPSAAEKIRSGETLYIIQPTSYGTTNLYTIKKGDTLYGVAKRFNTTVEKLLELNPGISEYNFRADDVIKIKPGSKEENLVYKASEKPQLTKIENYQVKGNESWEEIAQKTGSNVESLKIFNPDIPQPKKNEVISVPESTVKMVSELVYQTDPREESFDGREEIYDSLHSVNADDTVRIAIIADKLSNSRNLEFARGFLLALDKMKNSGSKVAVSFCDGLKTDSTVNALQTFNPNVIISSFEKDVPDEIINLSKEKKCEIVNVFDVKSELFNENPHFVHMLPPSSYFNDAVSSWVTDRFKGYNMIAVGSDRTDEIGKLVASSFGTHTEMPLESLAQYELNDDGKYLIYSYLTKKEDVAELLDTIDKLKENAPFAEVSIVGRPSWVTLAQSLKDKFDMADVFIPSRFYFDPESTSGKKFITEYTEAYSHGPLRSFPVYSVSGYDMANWIIPSLQLNRGDFNKGMADGHLLQNDVEISRVSNWGGFLNKNAYIVRFNPYGLVEKIVIK